MYWLAGALLVSLGMSVYAKNKLAGWKTRQFGDHSFQWNKIFTASSITSFVVSGIVFAITQSPWAAIAIAPLAYMLVLGSVTDFKISKIPMDISVLAYLIPIPLLLIFADSYGWFSFLVWTGVILLFLVFAYLGMFGLADLRIMILAGTSLSWWVGVENLAMAFGFSAIIQLIVHAFAAKMNLGTMKHRTGVKFELVKVEPVGDTIEVEASDNNKDSDMNLIENDETIVNSETIVDNVDDANSVIGESTMEDKANANPKKKKNKRFVPFGPALYLSFTLLSIVYGLYMVVDLRSRFTM